MILLPRPPLSAVITGVPQYTCDFCVIPPPGFLEGALGPYDRMQCFVLSHGPACAGHSSTASECALEK